MKPSKPYKVRPFDRVAAVGRSGTGKTHIVRKTVVEPAENVVFFDPKAEKEHTDMGLPQLTSIEQVEEALFPEDEQDHLTKFRYTPRRVGEDRKLLDALCYHAYKHGNINVVADELKGVYQDNNTVMPITDNHEAVMTRGRSKRVGFTSITQRPVRVPREAISEAQHFFVFSLNDEDDRRRMSKLIQRTPQEIGNLDEREYFYYHPHMDEASKHEPI